MIGKNEILLSGLSLDDFSKMMRKTIQEELQIILPIDDNLISANEACKLFKPAITKNTLKSWVNLGLIEEVRFNTRVYYKKSDIINGAKNIKKYKTSFAIKQKIIDELSY